MDRLKISCLNKNTIFDVNILHLLCIYRGNFVLNGQWRILFLTAVSALLWFYNIAPQDTPLNKRMLLQAITQIQLWGILSFSWQFRCGRQLGSNKIPNWFPNDLISSCQRKWNQKVTYLQDLHENIKYQLSAALEVYARLFGEITIVSSCQIRYGKLVACLLYHVGLLSNHISFWAYWIRWTTIARISQ